MSENNSHYRTLSNKQISAIAIVITSSSVDEGVRNAGVPRSTFYDWLKNPAFRAEMDRQEKELSDFTFRVLKSHARRAIEVLAEIRDNKNAENKDRIRACDIIITNSIKLKEIDTVEMLQIEISTLKREMDV